MEIDGVPMVRCGLSTILLAGGKSIRMGTDKAFLKLNGRPFVSILAEEFTNLSDDIIVVIGRKEIREFKDILDSSIRIMRDHYDYGSPVSGIATGLNYVKHSSTAIVACDLPLLKCGVIDLLYHKSIGHSASVPIWPRGDIEPLRAVYNVHKTRIALDKALQKDSSLGPRHIICEMKDVNFVKVSELKPYDRELKSLFNVNSQRDYSILSD